MRRVSSSIGVLFLSLWTSDAVNAQSNAELARAVQNPIANMISLPFQNNINTNVGDSSETQNILNIQPVWPVTLNDDWNVITRTIVPLVSQPDALTGDGRINGLGDTTFTAFLSPADASNLIWGAGPVLLFPTASDDALGNDQWGAGPSFAFVYMPDNWVVGSLFSNTWSVGGGGDQDVNLFTWQYFINYNLPDSWYLTTSPIITADWEADSDQRWTVPFGGGVGKIFRAGAQPMNLQASVYKNVETPDDGADWQIRLQLQFLFPK